MVWLFSSDCSQRTTGVRLGVIAAAHKQFDQGFHGSRLEQCVSVLAMVLNG